LGGAYAEIDTDGFEDVPVGGTKQILLGNDRQHSKDDAGKIGEGFGFVYPILV
jgi:hypothetical protein